MKYSYNWLKELADTKKDAHAAAKLLTDHAFEIEGLEESGKLTGVVVGKILEISAHPNADKLQLVKVEVKGKVLDIVCGAHNITVGDKVPVATVGTTLPNGLEIKEAEIRGEKSFGMLCAEDELGLGKDHSGIMILDQDAKSGTPIAEVLELDDVMIEIDVLANRAHDALSHVGMAREIAVLGGSELAYDYEGLTAGKKKTDKLTVTIKDKNQCSRYMGALIGGIKVGPSPQWLKNRLRVCGLRPINNIVDVTNYVMLEIGQPLHAFDFDVIKNAKGRAEIIVRSAKEDEELVLLDGSVKKLAKEDILITNKEQALALAGVMGGKDSGVSEGTQTIVLEAANFNPAHVRRTRMTQGLFTDAALRFEKGLDASLAEKALQRAIELLEHIAGGKLEGLVDEYPVKAKPWTLQLETEYVDRLLGAKIPTKEAKKILEALGFKVVEKKNTFTVTVPTFRLDVQSQEDLIEEIGRVYGYDKIKAIAPLAHVNAAPINETRAFMRGVKNLLVAQGFSEVYNYSFYSKRDAGLAELGNVKHLELENPANPEQALMRVSLIPNILKNVHTNLKNFKELAIFEAGRVFWPNGATLPEERNMLLGAVVLENMDGKGKSQKNAPSFFEAKGHCDALLAQLGIVDHYFDTFDPDGFEMPQTFWHQGRCAEIKIEGSQQSIGFVGEVNPLILTNFDIHTRVALFEFDLASLRSAADAEREFKPLRKYPVVLRDIALLSQGGVLVDQILQVIQKAGGDLVLDADLFDMFDFADGSTSFAFHLTFGADERTLTSQEVDGALSGIVEAMEKELGVTLRK